MTPSKRCTGCGRDLSPEAFHRDRTKRDGRVSQCRECLSSTRRVRRCETGAKRREGDRAALAANPTARRARRRHAAALADLTPDPDPEAAERAERIVVTADEVLRDRLGGADAG